MASYRVELANQAERIVRRMADRDPAVYHRIAGAFDDLGRDPLQGKPLKGELKGKFSYRVGSYRIVYAIRHSELLVLIIDVGHRRDIYR